MTNLAGPWRTAFFQTVRQHQNAVDWVETIDLLPEPVDPIRQIRGIGGTEFVFSKQVEQLVAGELAVNDFDIEVGAMKYGFALDGIIGLDFLLKTKAVINLAHMEIYQSTNG